MARAGILGRFGKREDGALSAATMVVMPLLIFAAAIAIDLTVIEAEKRYVQSQADVAALTAIRNFSSAPEMRDAARRTIDANTRYPTLPTPDSKIVIGTYDDGTFTPAADQTSTEGQTAVRVETRADAVMYLMTLFIGDKKPVVSRYAVATQDPRVSFALSNCLLELDLLRPILQPMIGAEVDVLCSGHGIDTAISGQGFFDRLSTEASFLTPSGSDMTYGDILDANLPVSSILGSALSLPITGGSDTIRLADFIYLSPDLRLVKVGQPLPPIAINASDIALASAELLAKRVATVDATLNLPSLGTVQAHVTVGDPRQIVLGARPGDPNAIASTSQIRVELPAVNIAGLFNLTLKVDLANAAARLTGEGTACSQRDPDVVAVFDPVRASLADIGLDLQVLGLPLNLSSLGHVVDAVAPAEVERVEYTREEAREEPVHHFGPSIGPDLAALQSSLRATVASMITTAASALGAQGSAPCGDPLGCLANAALSATQTLVNSILNSLNAAAPAVQAGNGLAGTATDALIHDVLGLGVAQADLTLISASCPVPQRLVE